MPVGGRRGIPYLLLAAMTSQDKPCLSALVTYTGSLLFVSGGDIGAAWNVTW